MRQVREKLESMKNPIKSSEKPPTSTDFSVFSTVSAKSNDQSASSSVAESESKENESYLLKNLKDWNLISELCERLENVIKLGRDLMNANTAQSFDRLAEYSFRAGSFIAQLILSESRTLEEVIIAIDELLNQYRHEICRDLAQNSTDIAARNNESSRVHSLTFKDLILQESEVLSVLTGFSSRGKLGGAQVGCQFVC